MLQTACLSPSLFFLSLCLSISFSFLATIFCFLFSGGCIAGVRATRQRGTSAALGTVCQLVERDSNSIGSTVRGRSWRAGPFRFFAPVPSFAFHRALPRPTKHADWFLYFYIKCPFHRVRCDTHRLRSILPTSGLSACVPVPPFPLSFLLSSLCSTTTDRHGTAKCGQHEPRRRERRES